MSSTPSRGVTPGLPTNSGSFKADERPESGISLAEDPFAATATAPDPFSTDPAEQSFETTFEQILAAGPSHVEAYAAEHGLSMDEIRAAATRFITDPDGVLAEDIDAHLARLGRNGLDNIAAEAFVIRKSAKDLASVGLDRCPDCGQFIDPTTHRCPLPFGKVEVKTGARTPWGTADHVNQIAPGIVSVTTPSHGGLKISPERNALIPPALRNRSGWYEEDTEYAIVCMHFPELAAAYSGYYAPADQQRWAEDRRTTVKDWFPDQYMAATGETLRPEDSYALLGRQDALNEEAFRAEHAEDFVTRGPGDLNGGQSWIPKGYAVMKAIRAADGTERHFLIPEAEAIENHSYRKAVLVDPNRHLDVTDVVTAEPSTPWPYRRVGGPKIHTLGFDTTGLTPAQAARAEQEINRRYRFANDDGSSTTETLGDHFERRGLTGKAVSAFGNRSGVSYHVEFGDSRILEVKEATWKALGGIPDTTGERGYADAEVRRAEQRLDRAQRDASNAYNLDDAMRARISKARADLDDARITAKRLTDEVDQQASAWQAERLSLQIAAFKRLTEDRDLVFED